MTQQEKLESLQGQAVDLVDALKAITELSRNDDSVDNHTLTLLEWTTKKAQALTNGLDEVVSDLHREQREDAAAKQSGE